MKLLRQTFTLSAFAALFVGTSACMSSSDGLGSSEEQVDATGQTQDLRHFKKHKKHRQHVFDKCEPSQCESVELYVYSFKHTQATREVERSIRVSIPEQLPALYWGSDVEAQLTFEDGDTTVVCTYVSESQRRGRALVLESCDNGAEATDVISFDSVTLKLACSHASFAKVHVKLHELEPCGEMECDPKLIDDGNPCTSDSCDPKLGVRHEPVAAGTSCGASADKCQAGPVCNAAGACVAGEPLECNDGKACNGIERCDPQTGCVPGTSLVCNDADACNGVEQCDDASGCKLGTPPVVDDMNDCTTDMCDPELGVRHVNVPNGTSCGTDLGCRDGECRPFT